MRTGDGKEKGRRRIKQGERNDIQNLGKRLHKVRTKLVNVQIRSSGEDF